ncbi:MAG: hypothetical protein HFE80_05355 [Clostridiaceae bacterium]|jgi:hypothetical protein|nr:hypothetical protein [Clostridiaceae bacterium]
MTKEAALYQFFSSFGLEAYAETAVPEDAVFPYLTYQAATSAFEEGEVSLTVNLWYHTEGEATPNQKAREISKVIGQGGVVLLCDGGYIWLKRGSPFCQNLSDQTDRGIKRRYINVTAEYLTQD